MVRLKCVFLDAKYLIWQLVKGKKPTLKRFFFFRTELHVCFDIFHTSKSKINIYDNIFFDLCLIFCCYSLTNSLCLFFSFSL